VSDFQVDVRGEEGTVHVALQGELDISSAGRVEKELREIEKNAPGVMVLDLRPLRFIDSTGLRLVLAADLRARRDGRRLVIVRGPDTVHRVFRIALLDRRLEFVDDTESLEGNSGGD
jgi:anti-sigma B factor antagonist